MRLSLVIDGNFLAVKNAFTLNNHKMLYGSLHRAMLANIERVAAMYAWEKIFFVTDGKPSWRVTVYPEYKANRVKGDELDWEFVFKTLMAVKKELDDTGRIATFNEPMIEGDDWINCICRKNNKVGIGNVVLSGDRDMLQLLAYSSADGWINFQIDDTMTRETTFIPVGYESVDIGDSKQNTDIFDLSSNGIDFPTFYRNITSWNVQHIDPNMSLFVKLVHGDKGDNINSIYESKTKTNKIVNIGEDGAISIWHKFNEMNSFRGTRDQSLFENVVDALSLVKKKQLSDEDLVSIKERLDRNIRIIELSPRHLPEHIAETIVDRLAPYYQ